MDIDHPTTTDAGRRRRSPRARILAAALLAGAVSVGGGLLTPGTASAQPADQCGSGGSAWVPDRGWAFDFSEACRRHDLCYGAKPYGSDASGRMACDLVFRDDARASCTDLNGPTGFRTNWCLDGAETYYLGVRIGGGGPFERAEPPVPVVTVGEPETIPTGTVTVGEPETIPTGTVTVGEPEVIHGGGGGGGPVGGGGGGFFGGGSIGGGGGGSQTGTVTVGEVETVQE